MAISHTIAIWALVIFAVLCAGGANAKSPAPVMSPATVPAPAMAPGPDCMTQIYNMSDCLTYVEQGSKTAKPDKGCCPELAGMLDSNPICLCQLLGKSGDFPVQLDLKRATNLPTACGLQAPPVSLCSAIGIPVGAGPAGSPTSSEGPSSISGMSPEAAGKNGASNAYSNVPYLVAAALAMALTSLLTL